MKIFLLSLAIIISAPSYAECDNSTKKYPKQPGEISVSFKDAQASEVVEHINSACEEYIEPITTTRPEDLISLNFEAIRCESAAAIIQDFDSSPKKT